MGTQLSSEGLESPAAPCGALVGGMRGWGTAPCLPAGLSLSWAPGHLGERATWQWPWAGGGGWEGTVSVRHPVWAANSRYSAGKQLSGHGEFPKTSDPDTNNPHCPGQPPSPLLARISDTKNQTSLAHCLDILTWEMNTEFSDGSGGARGQTCFPKRGAGDRWPEEKEEVQEFLIQP